tara:strand:- start:1565 stop:1945 length:381 start_codon:yes stop_codon:yes gene_type:complete
MIKTEAILANKRASSGLKPVANKVIKLASGRVSRSIGKEKQRLSARLDRELTNKYEQAGELRPAVESFWLTYDGDEDKDTFMAIGQIALSPMVWRLEELPQKKQPAHKNKNDRHSLRPSPKPPKKP